MAFDDRSHLNKVKTKEITNLSHFNQKIELLQYHKLLLKIEFTKIHFTISPDLIKILKIFFRF